MEAAQIYLFLNAALYLLFGAWCVIAPESTSQSVGLAPQGAKGMAEYFAVYGGLEAGMGAFFLVSAIRPAWLEAGLIFAVCLYAGIVLARSLSLVRNGSDIGMGWAFYGLEIVLGLAAVYLSLRRGIF